MSHSSFEVVYPLAVMTGRFMRIKRVIPWLCVLLVVYVVSGFSRTVFEKRPASAGP